MNFDSERNRFRTAQILSAALLIFLLTRFYLAGGNEQLCLMIFLFKVIGFFTSWILMLGSLRAPFFKRFCPHNPLFDCQKVIDSPAGTLFGLIHTADLGALYFGGSLLSLLIAAFSPRFYHSVVILAGLNILALPYTLFSVAYQALRVKKWCALCLIVQGILWLEFWQFFPFLFQNPIRVAFSPANLYPLILGFGLLLAVWPFLRQLLDKAYPLSKEPPIQSDLPK